MLTSQDIAEMVERAGEAFTWEGDKGGHRFTARVRQPMRLDIAQRQGGICPVCGTGMDMDNLPDDGEFNHVVAQGGTLNGRKVRRGYHPRNLFIGHPACNTDCERRYGRVIPVTGFKRPDVITEEFTPIPVLKASL